MKPAKVDVEAERSMAARALFAWEHGDGRGHILSLAAIAEALGSSYDSSAAVCRPRFADELRPWCRHIVQGPTLRYDPARRGGPGRIVTATWGEFLGDLGFADTPYLTKRLVWWAQTFAKHRTSLVVANYAPLALLAARAAGIPAIVTGQGYGIPPHGLTSFPVFLPEHAVRLHDEETMLAAVNEAGSAIGLEPLHALPDIYGCNGHVVRTFDMLDAYCGHRRTPLFPPHVDIGFPQAPPAGDEVFVYLSTSEGGNAQLVEAIATLGLRRRLYCPGLDAAALERLGATGAIVETMPVALTDIIRRSRVLVHAGQHGSLSLGLMAGLPQIAAPQQLEQLFHARRAEAAGVVAVVSARTTAQDIRAMIGESYDNASLALQARAVAATLPRMRRGEFRSAVTELAASL
jgi:hypothetical protein